MVFNMHTRDTKIPKSRKNVSFENLGIENKKRRAEDVFKFLISYAFLYMANHLSNKNLIG